MAKRDRGEALMEIDDIRSALRGGDLSAKPDLRLHLVEAARSGSNRDFFHLFAHVCRHDDVLVFGELLDEATEPQVIRTLLTCLGLSLSLKAIPILLGYQQECEDAEVDEYVCLALKVLFPLEGVDELTIQDVDAATSYKEATRALDQELYYYKGAPVFVGDVCKELIVASQVALREERGAMLVYQDELLAVFSGMKCPVTYYDKIDDLKLQEVYAYVRELDGGSWRHGTKYYFGQSL